MLALNHDAQDVLRHLYRRWTVTVLDLAPYRKADLTGDVGTRHEGTFVLYGTPVPTMFGGMAMRVDVARVAQNCTFSLFSDTTLLDAPTALEFDPGLLFTLHMDSGQADDTLRTTKTLCRGRIGRQYVEDQLAAVRNGTKNHAIMLEKVRREGRATPDYERVALAFVDHHGDHVNLKLLCAAPTRRAPYSSGKCLLEFLKQFAPQGASVPNTMFLKALDDAVPLYKLCGFQYSPTKKAWKQSEGLLPMSWVRGGKS